MDNETKTTINNVKNTPIENIADTTNFIGVKKSLDNIDKEVENLKYTKKDTYNSIKNNHENAAKVANQSFDRIKNNNKIIDDLKNKDSNSVNIDNTELMNNVKKSMEKLNQKDYLHFFSCFRPVG